MTDEVSRLGAVSRHVTSLRDEISGIITNEALERWAGPDVTRRSFLSDMIFGTIRWDKDLGRPATPTLADGFLLQHLYTNVTMESGPGGILEHRERGSVDPPLMWDTGPSDDQYLVSFVDKVEGLLEEAITAALAPVAWQGAAPYEPYAGVRRIEPPGYNLQEPTGLPVFMEFKVLLAPFFPA